tara:strand:+ start:336 stop:1268 length:933 start_codon:yes stop_codon:yes gene_type:complete
MIEKFSNLYKSLIHKKMKKFNLKSKKLLTTALFITSGLTILSHSNTVKAEACPSADTITSPSAFGSSVGSCYGTPEEYGVTIYRMGLCTTDPKPTAAGSAPDTSSCTFNFEKDDGVGEAASFVAGGEVDLSETYSSIPSIGSYTYAYIEIKNSFDIKAKYGPLGDSANTTYFTNGTFGEAGTVTGASATPPTGEYAATTAPMNTFYGDNGEEVCVATGDETVTGGTIRAYLLDSSDKLIADDSSSTSCSGVTKLLGIMQLNDTVNITSSTTSVKTTFKVTNNGTTVIYDNSSDGILFDSGPFSVTFETSE